MCVSFLEMKACCKFRYLNKMMCTGTGDASESERQALEVAERAGV